MIGRRRWVPILVLLVLGAASAEGKITIVQAKGANAQKKSSCPSKDGDNELEPIPVSYLAPAAHKNLLGELKGGDTKFPSPPWTFKKGKALNGTLNVDVYKSRFKDKHVSGGQISLRYVKGKGDPATLRWVQLIQTSRPLNKATSPYIDPFPNDDPKGKDLPFYYTESEIKSRTNGKNAHGKFDLRFYDFSSRSHPPTSAATWTADLYLASWDGKRPGAVTIHDGIRWGWKGRCAKPQPAVPAPDSSAMVPTEGSRIVLTGTVVAGEETTMSVVDPQGSVLTGVVVTVVGQDDYVTDDEGRITFTVPGDVPLIETAFRDVPGATPVETPVGTLPPGWVQEKPPVITDAPRYVTPGSDLVVEGGPFDGDAAGNTVTVGETDLGVRACSPTEIVASTPVELSPGDHGPLTVTTEHGTSSPWDVTFIGIGFESADTELVRGEKGKGFIVVSGTRDRLTLRVTNMTPGIISLQGGETLTVRTSGGEPNRAKIQYVGVSPGQFGLQADVIEEE